MDPQQRRLRTIRGPGSCRTIELRMFAACCNKNNVFVTGTRSVRDLSMQHPIGWQRPAHGTGTSSRWSPAQWRGNHCYTALKAAVSSLLCVLHCSHCTIDKHTRCRSVYS